MHTLTRLRNRLLHTPLITLIAILICIVVWVLQMLPGSRITNEFGLAGAYLIPALNHFEPWRILTSIFLHSPSWPMHIIFNMIFLWQLGSILEPALGKLIFALLFLWSGIGSAVMIMYLAPMGVLTIGASGALFGLFGAFFALKSHFGASSSALWLVLLINLVFTFLVPGISWQGHLGGLIMGYILGVVLRRDVFSRRLTALRGVWFAVILLGCIGLILARPQLYALF